MRNMFKVNNKDTRHIFYWHTYLFLRGLISTSYIYSVFYHALFLTTATAQLSAYKAFWRSSYNILIYRRQIFFWCLLGDLINISLLNSYRIKNSIYHLILVFHNLQSIVQYSRNHKINVIMPRSHTASDSII